MPTVVIAFLVNRFVQYDHLSSNSISQALVSQGEISGLLNLIRTLGGGLASLKILIRGVYQIYIPGFGVGFFQVSWAEKHGALQTMGCEAA